MEWRDRGIVLAARRHGESGHLLDVLTESHGRHGGWLRSARSIRGALEPGSDVDVTWRARLSEHLGTWTIADARVRAASCLDDARRLGALRAATAVSLAMLPEREPHAAVHGALSALLDAITADLDWPALYVRFELGLLQDLGFGLDLTACALTGVDEDLAYVSPKSGRAVTREAGAEWREKLLVLPAFLTGGDIHQASLEDIRDGLKLTGHFLERHAHGTALTKLTAARHQLLDLVGQMR